MKKVLVVIITVAAFFPTISQSLKEKKLKINYLHFPDQNIPSYAKTYTILCKGPGFEAKDWESRVRKSISIYSLDFVSTLDSADIIVEVNSSEFRIIEKKERSETKESNGQKTKLYWYDVTYTLPVGILIYNKPKTAFFLNLRATYQDSTVQSGKFAYGGAALANLVRDSDIDKLCLNAAAAKLRKIIDSKFNPKPKHFETVIYTASGKKLKYDDLDDAYSRMKELFKEDIEVRLHDDQKSELSSIANKWEEVLLEGDEYDPLSRINKVVMSGIKFNLAFAYAWLGEFEKSYASLEESREYGHAMPEKFELWLSNYQSGYMLTTPNADFEKVLIGRWRLSGLKNAKGEDMIEKASECHKMQVYNFKKYRKFEIENPEKDQELCETESIFWRVYTNKRDESRYLLYDEDLEYLNSDATGIFEIIAISQNRFEMKGEIALGGLDTTWEAYITYERID
ncbi:MAG: hypothetical protein RIC30_07415 [Marinoscillum sp.]|uniref:hypothetical protein n=1 Tax=Marinoscillum sp. TaxID=2024838 RepID=UPI0032FBFA8A